MWGRVGVVRRRRVVLWRVRCRRRRRWAGGALDGGQQAAFQRGDDGREELAHGGRVRLLCLAAHAQLLRRKQEEDARARRLGVRGRGQAGGYDRRQTDLKGPVADGDRASRRSVAIGWHATDTCSAPDEVSCRLVAPVTISVPPAVTLGVALHDGLRVAADPALPIMLSLWWHWGRPTQNDDV